MEASNRNIVNIVANDDFVPDYNFGYPCILHGAERILEELYGKNGYHLSVYCHSLFRKEMLRDYSSQIKYIACVPKKVLAATLLDKIGIHLKDKKISEMIDDVKRADLVVGLYPITFTGNFYEREKKNYLHAAKDALGQNLLLFLAKLYGKPTVKTVCSVGPFEKEYVAQCAGIAVKYLWDKIYVREKQSELEIASLIPDKKGAVISPDLANVMEFQMKENTGLKPIGVSVSFQIMKQWKGETDYIKGIAELCEYILSKIDRDILLIPNEYTPQLENSDIDVAEKIYDKLLMLNPKCQKKIKILDISDMTCQELKNEIVSCEVLIASRYHSCVAALSAGVPTLVVGWHWKYEELLENYEQQEWTIPMDLCEREYLIKKFDEFWEKREWIRERLANKKIEVYNNCMKYGKEMFRVSI